MTALERAFHLARSGQAATFSEIVNTLKREGYYLDQLQGPALKRQLVDLIGAAGANERLSSSPSPASKV